MVMDGVGENVGVYDGVIDTVLVNEVVRVGDGLVEVDGVTVDEGEREVSLDGALNELTVAPIPHWPLPLEPQHLNPPSAIRAQE